MGRPRIKPVGNAKTGPDWVAGTVLVAIESFSVWRDGADRAFSAGHTRIREGHPWLEGIEHLFKPVDAHYDIEQATAAPGERRGG